MHTPFFSVCIPTYNRAQSLRQAIKSVLAQSFADYEIVITDNCSPDDTERVVRSFHSKSIRYFKNESNLGMVGNWNQALGYAKGNYIAFLFDDDAFLPNHLKEAHKALTKNANVGIYAVGNQVSALPWQGLISAKEYFRYIYSMRYVSTPSETIFRRERSGKPYTISKKYTYCPEVELYLKVAGDGLCAYHSPLQTILRHSGTTSNSNVKAYTWVPFADKFAIIEKCKHHRFLEKNDYKRALALNARRAFEKYVGAKIKHIGEPEQIFQGIKNAMKRQPPFVYSERSEEKGLRSGSYSERSEEKGLRSGSYIMLYAMKIGVDIGTKLHLLSLENVRSLHRILSK